MRWTTCKSDQWLEKAVLEDNTKDPSIRFIEGDTKRCSKTTKHIVQDANWDIMRGKTKLMV